MLPQEIETFYIIPTIRKYLARFMKAEGMKQREIAKVLSLRDAAVSQYLNNKRGNKIDFDKAIIAEIKKAAKTIRDQNSMITETQRILNLIKKTKTLCELHRKFGYAPKGCNPEETHCCDAY